MQASAVFPWILLYVLYRKILESLSLGKDAQNLYFGCDYALLCIAQFLDSVKQLNLCLGLFLPS